MIHFFEVSAEYGTTTLGLAFSMVLWINLFAWCLTHLFPVRRYHRNGNYTEWFR